MKQDISGFQVRWDNDLHEQYQGCSEWINKTVADMAEDIASVSPNCITHVFEQQAYSVSFLLQSAYRLAGGLTARGLKPGDAVSFQLPNWYETAVIDLACSMLGLVVVPIVPIYRNAEVAFMLNDSRVKAAFFPGQYRGFDFAGMMAELAPELPYLEHRIGVRTDGPDDTFDGLVHEDMVLPERPDVDPDAVKLVLYTSGTTGKPKAVLHSHNTGPTRLKRGFEHWVGGDGDVLLMASPVTHVTGLSGLELPFYMNAKTVFMDRWSAEEALDVIDEYKVTVSLGATPFLQELLSQAGKHGRRLPSLKAFACGGAEVPPALIRRAGEVLERCRAFRVFGSSEVPLVTLGFVREGEEELAATTDGQIKDYQVKVVDDEGQPLPEGVEGELLIKGPAMFLGYASQQQTEDSFDPEGFFRTGDLGVVTSDNAITITGRKKDLINRGGEKISAKEVEDILHQLPEINEAAVVSMPHARLGETLCAYVIPKQGCSIDLPSLVAGVEGFGVAKQKIPEQVVVLDDFPRTASGKIRKDQLRNDIRERNNNK